jgi:2'-5' RNA ligase
LSGPLHTVWQHCEQAAQAAGLPAEVKPFHPHITLARIKERHPSVDLTQAIAAEQSFSAGEFAVRAVSLFQSELTPRGPVYTRLEEFRFA